MSKSTLTAEARRLAAQAETLPLATAQLAATAVYDRLKGRSNAQGWASLGRPADDVATLAGMVGGLAAFVRDEPLAPAEALYRRAARLGLHGGPADGWAAQPVAVRVAYEVFRATLIAVDRAFAEERAGLPEGAKARPAKLEDTIFEAAEGPFELTAPSRRGQRK